jgi:hypothetical protein
MGWSHPHSVLPFPSVSCRCDISPMYLVNFGRPSLREYYISKEDSRFLAHKSAVSLKCTVFNADDFICEYPRSPEFRRWAARRTRTLRRPFQKATRLPCERNITLQIGPIGKAHPPELGVRSLSVVLSLAKIPRVKIVHNVIQTILCLPLRRGRISRRSKSPPLHNNGTIDLLR